SLSRRGRRLLIAAVAIGASVPGIVFFALGAWPVVGFMGLDVLAVWWALSASTRAGLAHEQVTLWRDRLEVRQVSASGAETRTDFSPFYARLEVRRAEG